MTHPASSNESLESPWHDMLRCARRHGRDTRRSDEIGRRRRCRRRSRRGRNRLSSLIASERCHGSSRKSSPLNRVTDGAVNRFATLSDIRATHRCVTLNTPIDHILCFRLVSKPDRQPDRQTARNRGSSITAERLQLRGRYSGPKSCQLYVLLPIACRDVKRAETFCFRHRRFLQNTSRSLTR